MKGKAFVVVLLAFFVSSCGFTDSKTSVSNKPVVIPQETEHSHCATNGHKYLKGSKRIIPASRNVIDLFSKRRMNCEHPFSGDECSIDNINLKEQLPELQKFLLEKDYVYINNLFISRYKGSKVHTFIDWISIHTYIDGEKLIIGSAQTTKNATKKVTEEDFTEGETQIEFNKEDVTNKEMHPLLKKEKIKLGFQAKGHVPDKKTAIRIWADFEYFDNCESE